MPFRVDWIPTKVSRQQTQQQRQPPPSVLQSAQDCALSRLFLLCCQLLKQLPHELPHPPYRSHLTAMSGACGCSGYCPSSWPHKPQRSSTEEEVKGEGPVPAFASLPSLFSLLPGTDSPYVDGWVFHTELCCIWKLSVHHESWFLLSLSLTTHMTSSPLSDYLPPV